jgi:hypothetical protein
LITDNTRNVIIKKVILKKCSYYYEFEEIMRDSSTIALSFVIKFTQSNISQTVTKEDIKEIENDKNIDKAEYEDFLEDEDNNSMIEIKFIERSKR